MHGRQIAIVLAAAVVAFGAAFAVGKATSSSDASGGSPTVALKAVSLAGGASVGAVTTGSLPALKVAVVKKRHHKPSTTKPHTTATAVPTQAATSVPTQVATS